MANLFYIYYNIGLMETSSKLKLLLSGGSSESKLKKKKGGFLAACDLSCSAFISDIGFCTLLLKSIELKQRRKHCLAEKTAEEMRK